MSLKRRIKKILSPFKRIGLKNKDFTIICNNCFAGHYYDDYNMKYLTPTIGLVIPPKSYIKFISNMKYYLDLELKEVKSSDLECYDMLKRKDPKSLLKPLDSLVCGKLDDVEIIFLHYKSFEDANAKWERRKLRINYNNILYKFNDQNELEDNEYDAFMNVKLDNKLFITSNTKYKDGKNTYFVKKYENLGYVLDDLHTNLNFKKLINNIKRI